MHQYFIGRAGQTSTDTDIVTSNKELIEISKFLSYVLRHKPAEIGLSLDREGWADISTLLAAAVQAGRPIDLALIEHIVSTSEKKRFTISPDGLRIRAAQGHSNSSVIIDYPEMIPPEFLYHGTALRFLEAIHTQGLVAGERHHVHLSEDKKTASIVGKRHGAPTVLIVASGKMQTEGFKFYRAENGVWLTDNVPLQFIF